MGVDDSIVIHSEYGLRRYGRESFPLFIPQQVWVMWEVTGIILSRFAI